MADDKLESNISSVLEKLSLAITADDTFKNVRIVFDYIELDKNNLPDSAILIHPRTWFNSDDGCSLERRLDIILIITSYHKRTILRRLWLFSERMKELLDELMLTETDFELRFIGGSEIGALRNNREDSESYKGSKTLFTSIISLNYILRY